MDAIEHPHRQNDRGGLSYLPGIQTPDYFHIRYLQRRTLKGALGPVKSG
jgi:hypothetical protein